MKDKNHEHMNQSFNRKSNEKMRNTDSQQTGTK